MICFGHRGAMGHAPENTLESFELAIQQGANSIELDIVTIENQAVVFHDDDLERLCNVKGSIFKKTLAELAALKVLGKSKIPMLGEVFDLVKDRVGINIELKSKGSAEAVARTVKENNYDLDNLLVSSFDHKELQKIKTLLPSVKIGALQVSIPKDNTKFAQDLGAYSAHMSLEFIDQEFVNDAHQRGLKVFVFTVNKEADFQRMNALKVDGVFTNYPDLFFNTFKKVNTRF